MSVERARDWLSRARNADGTFGYLVGQPGRGEPTLLAVASGQPAPLEWLASTDLGYARLLLPAALIAVPEASALRRSTAELLLELRGEEREHSDDLGHDATIPGWSWVPGTSPWVEPTSYALLSLLREGFAEHERVREGRRMIADRQCDDGGWNYGNTAVLGQRLTGDTQTTAWAAMALPPGPVATRALAFLEARGEEPASQSLALNLLARVAHRAPLDGLAERLAARQGDDGSFNARIDTTALAAIALQAATEGTHVFDLAT